MGGEGAVEALEQVVGHEGDPQASPGESGKEFPRALCLFIPLPNILIAGGHWLVQQRVDSDLSLCWTS